MFEEWALVLCFPPGFSILPGPMASPTSETYGHVGWLGGHGSLSSMPPKIPTGDSRCLD